MNCKKFKLYPVAKQEELLRFLYAFFPANMGSSLIFFLLFTFLLPYSLSAEDENKSVLYLNSYHNGYHWSDGLLEGVRSVLQSSRFRVDLQIEYMDAKKFSYATISKNLYALYVEKFKQEQFDIVIAADNDALNFVNQYRDDLFAGLPVVFCGNNNFEPADIRAGNITGVVEIFDLIATLKTAQKLHPKRDHLIILIDDSTTGNAIRRQVEKITAGESLGLKIEYWVQLSLEEAQERVRSLPDNSFIFIAPYYQTINGRFYTSEEVSRAIYKHSSVPIYTAWEFMVGNGAVGGKVLSGHDHGETAGNIVLDIFEGTDINEIPIINERGGVYIFDHSVMAKLKINQRLLPENSTIINGPETLYSIPKELFWSIMISLIILLLLLVSTLGAMLERRKFEQKIIDQLTFQETLMDTIPQLVSWKDCDGNYLGANQAFMDFFGINSADEVVGKNTGDIITRDKTYSDWSENADKETMKSRQGCRRQRRVVQKGDKTRAWIDVNKVPLVGQGGRLVGVLTTAENVTKEQSLEEQLFQSQKMEAIGTLAGGISHDFNNILTSIINSTELAMGDLTPGSQTEADLERVLKAAKRGGRLIQQILSFSRPSREGYRATDLSGITQEVVQLLEASIPANIEITLRLDPLEKYIVHADPTQVHQAVLNLCTNAYHALRQTGGNIELELSHEPPDSTIPLLIPVEPGQFIQISVSDSGPGIPSEIIDKIFEPFFSTKSKPEGTGLGLAVVHGIVKSHQGTIQLTSDDKRGSTFRIFLPRSEDEEKSGYRENAKNNMSGHILFVEDDDDQLETTPRLLKELGYSVTAIKDPVKAVEMCRGEGCPFDLIITDFDMPVFSGAELAGQVRHLPVIIVSGREDARMASKGLLNVCQVIRKPYNIQEIGIAAQKALQKEIHHA